MNHPRLLSISAALLLLVSCGTNTEKVTLNTQQDTLSWAMGMSLAQTAQSGFYQFDDKLIMQAFQNTLAGGKQPLDTLAYLEAREYIKFLTDMYYHKQAQASSQRADTIQNNYFAQLLTNNPNIKTSPRGFYYEVLKSGNGPTAKEGQRIRFDFKGSNMLTGQVIEQTYGVRDPIIHVLGHPMFEGLLYGMQLMNTGSIYRFYFPHQLVTNANGIPPYTPVIYEVELHEIYND